jgi:hypothetical protein
MKLQFYIDNDDAAERCRESLRLRKLIGLEGEDPFTGRVKRYAGVVLAVENASADAVGQRWRIAIDTELVR